MLGKKFEQLFGDSDEDNFKIIASAIVICIVAYMYHTRSSTRRNANSSRVSSTATDAASPTAAEAFAGRNTRRNANSSRVSSTATDDATGNSSVKTLRCIRERRSVFPRYYVDRAVDKTVVQSLLDAAMLAPFHGSRPPWHFAVLGRSSMVEMQQLTLKYYDANYETPGVNTGCWGSESDGSCSERGNDAEYQQWREMTEEEITGRWGPCETNNPP